EDGGRERTVVEFERTEINDTCKAAAYAQVLNDCGRVGIHTNYHINRRKWDGLDSKGDPHISVDSRFVWDRHRACQNYGDGILTAFKRECSATLNYREPQGACQRRLHAARRSPVTYAD